MSDENKRLLEKQLWAVANVLRGKMNADEYKNYVLGFIFYKYLCHRSQFGLTHRRITGFFKKAQLFGFTGTPIFADNNVGGSTTADVFKKSLHKYIITHAIDDNNVLGFAVEYVGRYTQKAPDTLDADIFAEVLVEGINTREVLESDDRLNKISAMS